MTHFQVSMGHLFSKKSRCQFNSGHMSYWFKMLTEQDIIDYLHTLTTMQVIEKGSRLSDIKALFQCHNIDPPYELLADIQLIKMEILARFELIEIILNSITVQFMADITSSIALKMIN